MTSLLEIVVLDGFSLKCKECGAVVPYGRFDMDHGICSECWNSHQREGRKQRKMKQVDKEYYDSFSRHKKHSPAKAVARKIIDEFVASGMDIVEVDATDFEGLFDFKDGDGAAKAAATLGNLLNTSEFAKVDAYISCRKGHVFIMRKGMRDDRVQC